MKWKRIQSKSADSISSGDYRIHKSGKIHRLGTELYTAYRMNPFTPIGIFKSAKEAKQACREYEK